MFGFKKATHATDWGLTPNARFQLLPEAGATQERTLEAVSCKPLLGSQKRILKNHIIEIEPLRLQKLAKTSHIRLYR